MGVCVRHGREERGCVGDLKQGSSQDDLHFSDDDLMDRSKLLDPFTHTHTKANEAGTFFARQ